MQSRQHTETLFNTLVPATAIRGLVDGGNIHYEAISIEHMAWCNTTLYISACHCHQRAGWLWKTFITQNY